MKINRIFITLLVLLFSLQTQAQTRIFNFDTHNDDKIDPQVILSAGFGYPNIFRTLNESAFKEHFYNNGLDPNIYNGVTTFSTSFKGAYLVKGEYRFRESQGVGINLGYSTAEWNATSVYTISSYFPNIPDSTKHQCNEKIRISSFSFTFRDNYYWTIESNFQIYSGFGIGFTFNKITNVITNDGIEITGRPLFGWPYSSETFNFCATAGARFFIDKHLGVYGEFGYEKWSILQGGIIFKL